MGYELYGYCVVIVWLLCGSSYNQENRAANTLLMGFDFNASKSNSIYGASTTVQPASYLVRYYIKAS